jgi:plastocyanin
MNTKTKRGSAALVIHPFPHRLRLFVAALCAVLLPLAFSTSASATQPPQPRTWHVAVGEETRNDAIQGMAFLPGTIWINQGDQIIWTAKAGEIHTVSFLASGQPLKQPFDPSDPMQLLPQGTSHYDGVSYYNSGVMTDEPDSGFPAQTTYGLTFDVTGDFTYYCLVHGEMMKGLVHVRPAGTHYPFTQKQYNHQAAAQKASILRDGRRLWAETTEDATRHLVFAGADDGTAMVMRFINAKVTVHVGSSVTFKNINMAAPHTITFGPEQANIFAPYGDPTHFSGQQLNSGILLPGSSFTVTFTKAGTYHYVCALHDYLGMVGTVKVLN